MTDARITSLSDRAALISFGETIHPAINEKVLCLHRRLQQSSFEGFIESVPAYASLAVFYEARKIKARTNSTAFDFVKNYLQQLLLETDPGVTQESAIQKIPACYHPDFGIDINEVAAFHGLSIDEVISLHTSVIYRVYMIGFLPGFAYMGTVTEKLITPRKEQPRLQVSAGSIGIAGAQTGIYPADSPGGWQIIGKTPLQLFDIGKPSPCLLAAGDLVQFVAIDPHQFKNDHAR